MRISSGFRKSNVKKAVQTYYVVTRVRGKRVSLTPRPLTLPDAKDFLAYKLDNTLTRSGWFEPIGTSKTVVRPPVKMRKYFTRNRAKLRPYKIRVGQKKAIRNGYIEKTRHILDTRTEKAQLSRAIKKKVVRKRVAKKKPTKHKNRR